MEGKHDQGRRYRGGGGDAPPPNNSKLKTDICSKLVKIELIFA